MLTCGVCGYRKVANRQTAADLTDIHERECTGNPSTKASVQSSGNTNARAGRQRSTPRSTRIGRPPGTKEVLPDGVWSVQQVVAYMQVRTAMTIRRWVEWGIIPPDAVTMRHDRKYYLEAKIRELGRILSTQQVAQRYGVTRQTINRWRNAGRITGITTPSGTRLYREKELPNSVSTEGA